MVTSDSLRFTGLAGRQGGFWVGTHRDLEVWRRAIDLAGNVYEVTRTFPKEESFGLVSQMRRAAVSVASNIAEGAARHGPKEFIRFLYVALGSASELDTQIEISVVTGMGQKTKLEAVQEETGHVARMLLGLIRSLQSKTQQKS